VWTQDIHDSRNHPGGAVYYATCGCVGGTWNGQQVFGEGVDPGGQRVDCVFA